MIVDSSAIIAVIQEEPEAARIVSALRAGVWTISAGTLLETAIVVDRKGAPLGWRLDNLLEAFEHHVAPVTAAQVRVARAAYGQYGRGSGHPANLNFGDCFAYALAVETGEPLLFKGDDFTHTDVTSALA